MASLAAFVFLLENLAGFENNLNSTFHDMSHGSVIHAPVSQCDPVLGDMIWQDIKRNYFQFDNKLNYEDNYVESIVKDDTSSNRNIDKIVPDNEGSVNNIKNSSFMVAIFESVLNITAQTCGGTLVSPHWVLTAATCVDLLSHLYKNKNSNILDSQYYIVANGMNPLIDGTVHNVTDVLFQPKYYVNSELSTSSPSVSTTGIKIPSLALLRIEPPVKEGSIEIVSESLRSGVEVEIYSWVLNKNSTTKQQTMTVATFEAITSESNDCKANYSFIEDNSLICLSTLSENDVITHLMNSGGPVVVSADNNLLMAAVAQLDLQSNIGGFVGYLLHPHYSWILEVISK